MKDAMLGKSDLKISSICMGYMGCMGFGGAVCSSCPYGCYGAKRQVK